MLICEKSPDCMKRASYNNQARVHSGYHYPRSLLTALRSCVSCPRFVAEFPEAVRGDFGKYYAIGKLLGKINARQFEAFCVRIGAPCEEAPPKVKKMFSDHYIEEVFLTREYAFDAEILRRTMVGRCEAAGCEIALETEAVRVAEAGPGRLSCVLRRGGEELTATASEIYNCTYSQLNFVNSHSEIELIPLKHEMTEMALVKVPDVLENMGITVMCGPFFSVMPFPDRGLHTLSHVRYTPHYEWFDEPAKGYRSANAIFDGDRKESYFTSMRNDAARYLPVMGECEYRDSLWEVKTLLPASEVDDSRPILFKTDYRLKGYHCVMGGKIDNVYDVIEAIKTRGTAGNL